MPEEEKLFKHREPFPPLLEPPFHLLHFFFGIFTSDPLRQHRSDKLPLEMGHFYNIIRNGTKLRRHLLVNSPLSPLHHTGLLPLPLHLFPHATQPHSLLRGCIPIHTPPLHPDSSLDRRPSFQDRGKGVEGGEKRRGEESTAKYSIYSLIATTFLQPSHSIQLVDSSRCFVDSLFLPVKVWNWFFTAQHQRELRTRKRKGGEGGGGDYLNLRQGGERTERKLEQLGPESIMQDNRESLVTGLAPLQCKQETSRSSITAPKRSPLVAERPPSRCPIWVHLFPSSF